MQATVHVFVSSTKKDLRPERKAVETVVNQMRATKFVGMEYFGSRDETTAEASLAEVGRCQLYIGILGGRYGSGITEQEYRRAIERQLPCLIYFKRDDRSTQRDRDKASAAKLRALKKELKKQHTVKTYFAGPDDLAAMVATDLHNWLFDKYLGPRLEALLQGGRPEGDLDALLGAVRELSALGKDLVSRLQTAGLVSAQLADAYIDPTPVFRRVKLEQFVGREWITAAIEAFQQSNDCGYFVLEAKSGMGKTAYLAHYAQHVDCVHHFCEQARGSTGITQTIRNIAAQLVNRWRLPRDLATAHLAEPADRPDLQSLLFRIAAHRDETDPGRSIIIVVDALDEAGTPEGQNVLGLPQVLPRGVYLVVSQQPVGVSLNVQAPRTVFKIEAGNTDNRHDAEVYVTSTLQAAGSLAFADVQAAIDALLDKSDGNWIYLHHVIAEIQSGERKLDDLQSLPNGLWQYYARHWLAWSARHSEDWNKLHLPVLAALAAAQEAVSGQVLAALANVPEPGLTKLLEQHWLPFLNVYESVPPRYGLHHASLREFLEGHVNMKQLTAPEQSFTRSLANAVRSTHSAITNRYLNAWGGLKNHLPGLRDVSLRELDERYGLKHLVVHLERAARHDELHALLALEWRHEEITRRRRSGWLGLFDRIIGRLHEVHHWRVENAWYTAHEETALLDNYLADLHHAWHLARTITKERVRSGKKSSTVAWEIRYALIKASINSMAGRLPPAILSALVQREVWPVDHALMYARRILDPIQRARALTVLAAYIPDAHRAGAVREAYDTARQIEDPGQRCQSITELLASAGKLVPAGASEAALDAALQIEKLTDMKGCIERVAPFLTSAGCRHAMQFALGRDDWEGRFDIMETLANNAPAACQRRVRGDFDAIVKRLSDSRSYGIQATIAPYLEGEQRKAVIAEALRHAAAARYEYPVKGTVARIRLAEAASDEDKAEHWKSLVDDVLSCTVPVYQSEALGHLAPKLDGDPLRRLADSFISRKLGDIELWNPEGMITVAVRCAQTGDCARAFALVQKLNVRRDVALGRMAPYLPAPWLDPALRLSDSLDRDVRRRVYNEATAKSRDIANARIPAMLGLAPRLAALGRVEEALFIVRSLTSTDHTDQWVQLLEAMAPHLPAAQLKILLGLARVIDDGEEQTSALARFARFLPANHVASLLIRTRRIGKDLGYIDPGGFIDPGGRFSSSLGMEERAGAAALLGRRLAELGYEDEALASVARSMGKEMIVYRARAMAALAPALSERGLAEALAAADAIEPLNRATERLYATLAPYLPMHLRKAALAKAYKVPVQDFSWIPRMLLLGQLAPQLEEPERSRAAKEALMLWREHKSRMGPELREEAFDQILTAALSSAPEDTLAEVRSYFSDMEQDPKQLAHFLNHVLEHLPDSERTALVSRMIEVHGAASARPLARHLSEPLLRSQLAAIIKEGNTDILFAAGTRLAELGFANVAMRCLIKHAPPADALRWLADQAFRPKPALIAEAWGKFLPAIAQYTRGDLLNDLGKLASVVIELGGESVASEIVDVTDSVGRCWR
ncbi:DUF4062 domain-containing protein [Nordella sp. HKS 07]|uniref:DUF4062 domain-containing protein n=1 Tax=Nordella sp. HKS 07 TaxID=2712222 RepID=UPI0013E1C773|nr:DUF4062 domain-containing protein [Nordella sp. HKS 07]QIG49441.1 DUF4062 domain-containing protein [Nordella sp. HKS 07]